MIKRGIHPKVVQERLGHSSIEMTIDTYSHVAPSIQEAVPENALMKYYQYQQED